MSKNADAPAFSLGALNICTGGTQIVNVYGAGGCDLNWLWKQFRLRLLFDDFEAVTTNGDPHGDRWCVTETSTGVGTIIRYTVFYNNDLDPETTIYARVYDELTGGPSETYVHGDSRYVLGVPNANRRIWTWANSLTDVTFGSTEIPHHVRVFKVTDTVGVPDDTSGFVAVPCTGSGYGSNGGPLLTARIPVAHGSDVEIDVPDGDHAGRHLAEYVGRMVWKIVRGSLNGAVVFNADGGSLTVRTPNGPRTFPASRERPFSVVLPGELFGATKDVVVSAP